MLGADAGRDAMEGSSVSMNSNEPKDGSERRERAVAEGTELRERAVENAREVGGALGLKEAPVSPDAPPPYPAPPIPAPPYPPRRALKETLPSTPRAIARQAAEPPSPEPEAPEPAPATSATEPAASAAAGPATER
jgi:hypothetical protein